MNSVLPHRVRLWLARSDFAAHADLDSPHRERAEAIAAAPTLEERHRLAVEAARQDAREAAPRPRARAARPAGARRRASAPSGPAARPADAAPTPPSDPRVRAFLDALAESVATSVLRDLGAGPRGAR